MTASTTRRRLALLAFLAALALAVALPAAASAANPAPGWLVSSVAEPTNFSFEQNATCSVTQGPRFCDRYLLTITNVGGSATSEPISIVDTLPAGLIPAGMRGEALKEAQPIFIGCDVPTTSCGYGGTVNPGETIAIYLEVEVASAGSDVVTNSVTVEGGGATAAAVTSMPLTMPNTVNGPAAAFGLADFGMSVSNSDATVDGQAAGHPNRMTTLLNFNTTKLELLDGEIKPTNVQPPKDAAVTLPLGFVGDPLAAATCTAVQLNSTVESECPPASRVGSALVFGEGREVLSPAVYNMVPEKGYPAQLAFKVASKEVSLYASVVHTSSGYALRVADPGLPRTLGIEGFGLTLFGDPHTADGEPELSKPFFTNPSDCSAGRLSARIEADSWIEPGNWVGAEGPTYPEGVSGCNQLEFKPTIEALPSTNLADSPAGLDFNLDVPQAPSDPETPATPPLRDATVKLPEGLNVNPSSATGLAGCPATGSRGINVGSDEITPQGQDLGDPEATELGDGQLPGESPYGDGLYHTAPGHCPAASQLGTVEVKTPLLKEPLGGNVYLGTPDCSPCTNEDAQNGKLIKLYIEIDDPQTGVIVKLPGTVSADPKTGRLTASFKDNPQFPVKDLKLHFKQGARAPLRTPSTCGSFTTTTDLKPWSAPETLDAEPASEFNIASGPGGAPCPQTKAARPFAPELSAGAMIPTAGSFSPFLAKVTRPDGAQELQSLNFTLPPGLTGKLAGVAECSEAQIAAAEHNSGKAEKQSPSCPLASQLGTVNAGAGAGPTPFYVQGHAYLAGPYKGAPLSLAILTPALAGPFDLGTVVVRTALYVNPETAQITARSDPVPTILAGIPLDIRSVAVSIDRGQFTLNPTSCDPMQVAAALFSSEGASANLANRFQVGGCPALGFKPKLAIKLKGATRRAGNPALRATVTYPKGGSYANIARAQVTLPHSEFLDNAHIGTVCTRVQFAESACPADSVYGYAKATSPLLDNPLQGPVYLRSSSNKLPDLVAALGGQITVDLDGKVDTGKGGGIRNTFEVVPDAPVTKFVLSMKGGSKGLLENSENICSHPQKALAHFVAQNGKVDNFSPTIANSCKAKKHHKRKG